MNAHGVFWLGLAFFLPWLLASVAALPGVRRYCLGLLPFASLPALGVALWMPGGAVLTAPDLLLGMQLALDDGGRGFLGAAAFLWCVAGLYARRYLRRDPHRAGFAALWCLTLAGNLGVFLAADVVTFYACFACVSLAAYPLVIHERDARARRAGLVYIVLALIGETCLLLGFMLAVSGSPELGIPEVRAAIAGSPWRAAILGLLFAGFGIKAGLVPLHVWLPLAHPAAPTPASAVLSGAIVKAGIFGLIQFLPFGLALPGWHQILLWCGLVSAFYGMVAGLAQHNPKTVLAYSTVSQMGLVAALLAMALQQGPPQAALAVAGFYALHHGLAKGALFLGVGVAASSGGRALRAVLIVLALPALSLAGFPLLGGALAKLGAKLVLGEGVTTLLFTVSAIGTALLMLRFLFLLKGEGTASAGANARAPAGLLLPWWAAVAASVVAPWAWFTAATGLAASYPLALGNLWAAAWPVAVAAVLAWLARRSGWRAPAIPEGDLLVPLVAAGARLASWFPTRFRGLARLRLPAWRPTLQRWFDAGSARAERSLSRWSISGVLLLALAILAAF
ncbi:MAG: complex I subunit 5 family protein [Pigmentiphaga sp.]|nr:complex I subunit 5 family protein [Pigmentiphaga sp.]